MPELPEVETTCLGISPYLKQQFISDIIIREHRLRWPIEVLLSEKFSQKQITSVSRRGKYIIISCDKQHLLIHLGMSGSLRVITPKDKNTPIQKHEHYDIVLSNQTIIRYKDPRRFGCLIFTTGDPYQHKLLASLGPEPLSKDFKFKYFYQNSRHKKQTIKQYIMDAHQVVGVGNIYASEALFLSGIRPGRAAGSISLKSCKLLYSAIISVLDAAIKQGGTTLKDFTAPSINSKNQAGYFQQELNVYNRLGQACKQCKTSIKQKKIGQRSSFYCPQCQK